MVSALIRLATLLALLLAGTGAVMPGAAWAQPLFSGVEQPGGRQATAQDVINALNAARAAAGNTVNGLYTNPSFSLDGTARLATQWLTTARQADKAVFVGGVGSNYHLLAQLAPNDPLLTNGRIGLYQHANGNAALTPAQLTALWQTWSVTGAGVHGGGQSVGEVGSTSIGDPGYLGFFGGAYPNQVDLNVLTNSGSGTGTYTAGPGDVAPGTVYPDYFTAADLAAVQAAVLAANSHGARSVAPFITPNGSASDDLADPFATGAYWANVRAAALFAGGLGIDAPPSYFLARASNYGAMVIQMIQWGVAHGLRVSYVISPYALSADIAGNRGGCGYDPVFMENTRTVIGMLRAAAAFPTQFVIENYGLPGPGCGTENDWAANDNAAESLNAVALYIADTVPTAPTGTTPAGSSGIAEAGLESPASLVPVLAPSLSARHVGQLSLLDFVGWGTMAPQNSDSVDISGGILTGVTLNNPVINAFTSTGQAFLSGGDIVGGAHVIQGPGGAVAMDMNTAGTLSIAAPGGGDTMVKLYGSLLADNVGVSGAPINSGLFTNLRTSGQAFFAGGDIVQGAHVVQGPGGAVAMDLNTAGTLSVAAPGGGDTMVRVYGSLVADNVGVAGAPISSGLFTNLRTAGQAFFAGGDIVQGAHVVQGPGGAVAMDLNTAGTLTVAMPGGSPATMNVLQGTILAANIGSDASPIAVSYLTNLNVFGAMAFMNGLIGFPVSGPGAVATSDPGIPGRMWADPANDWTVKLSKPAA